LYAGDGTTVGGNRISGSTDGSPAQLTQNLNLNSNNITGTGNININGFVTADFNGGLIGDVLGDIQGSVFAKNSTLLVDALDGIIFAENVRGEFTGNVIGDIKGSVFGDDSSIIVDGLKNELNGTLNGNINNLNNELIISSEQEGNFFVRSNAKNGVSFLNILRISDSEITGPIGYGAINFGKDDINGRLDSVLIFGSSTGLTLAADDLGLFPENKSVFLSTNGSVGIGTYSPQENLDVRGNANIEGFVQFGSLTTIARDALTAANGMIIYNITDNKFQGYQSSTWINLDDGTAA